MDQPQHTQTGMKTLDRYILKQFLANYFILLVVICTLVVTIDLIVNVDEFLKAGQRYGGSWGATIGALFAAADYYGPQLLVFYIYISGLLPAGAAAFTLSALVRNRELTAMIAGGVSLYRVATPLLAAGVFCGALLMVDQELIIPRLTEKLSRGQTDMQYGHKKPFRVQFAPDEQGALFSAARFDPRDHTLHEVTIIRRDERGLATQHITAELAAWDDGRRGWRLNEGWAEARISDTLAAGQTRQAIDFVATDLDPNALLLRRNASFRQLLSLGELRELLSKPRLVDVRNVERIVHSRFSLVVVNVLMLTMVLPFYLVRAPANLLVQSLKAAPLCLGAWAGGFIILQVDLPMAPPAVSAWLPVVMYAPVAAILMDRIET